MESIFKRRSVRKYKEQQVEKEKIEKLLRAAMQAPSARNQQCWEFIVVEDKEKLNQLSNMGPNAKLIENAPLAIVVLGNEERMTCKEYWEQDLGASTQNILLEAVNLNLGSVWIGTAPHKDRMDHVSNIFNLKENLKPFCIISIGYPLDDNANKFIDRFDETRVQYF